VTVEIGDDDDQLDPIDERRQRGVEPTADVPRVKLDLVANLLGEPIIDRLVAIEPAYDSDTHYASSGLVRTIAQVEFWPHCVTGTGLAWLNVGIDRESGALLNCFQSTHLPKIAADPSLRHPQSMVLLRLYWDCWRRALRGVGKSPWTLALPVGYLAMLIAAGILTAPLGIIGGFVVLVLIDLCTSSFLYFVAQAVLGSPARASELKRSFIAYFWPVVSFGFVIWVARLLVMYALAAHPKGGTIQLGIWAVAAVLLNAVPETIYQKDDVSGLAIIAASVRFIQEHWIEWFIPNILLVGALYVVVVALARVPFGVLLVPLVEGALLYVAMAFRGVLYLELETSSPYQRRMRYRGK
jgi:hypothetical protein